MDTENKTTVSTERDPAEIAEKFKDVNLEAVHSEAKELTEMFRKLPEVERAFNVIRQKLNSQYQHLEFPSRPNPEAGMKLPYHNVRHSEDVFETAITLGVLYFHRQGVTLKNIDQDGLQALLLLGIKAAYHDSGFIMQYASNEDAGAMIAKESMILEGYDPKNIDNVQTGIHCTVPSFANGFSQKVDDLTSIFDKLLCDADVANFGREDFFERSDEIFEESKVTMGIPVPAKDSLERGQFDAGAIRMLTGHKWNTYEGYFLFEKQKRKNIQILENKRDGIV